MDARGVGLGYRTGVLYVRWSRRWMQLRATPAALYTCTRGWACGGFGWGDDERGNSFGVDRLRIERVAVLRTLLWCTWAGSRWDIPLTRIPQHT